MTLSRRRLLGDAALTAIGLIGFRRLAFAQPGPPITVYKDPSCGCCAKWVDHMRANGFTASVTETTDMDAIKVRYKVGEKLRSCHTTLAGGYVIEGHVPADDVKRLLKEKPKGIAGLTIPGMPQSAPGMDLTPHRAYEVLSFDPAGATKVWAKR